MVKGSLCLFITGTALYIETFLFDKFAIFQSTDHVEERVIFVHFSNTDKKEIFVIFSTVIGNKE